MSTELVERSDELPNSLDGLAALATVEHEACETAVGDALGHAIRAGEALTVAKARVGHGKWLPWLKDHFPASVNTAGHYMRLARNSQRVGNLGSVRAGLAELAETRTAPVAVEDTTTEEPIEADVVTEGANNDDASIPPPVRKANRKRRPADIERKRAEDKRHRDTVAGFLKDIRAASAGLERWIDRGMTAASESDLDVWLDELYKSRDRIELLRQKVEGG